MTGTIYIQNLDIQCIIGILPDERIKKQKLLLDIELDYDFENKLIDKKLEEGFTEIQIYDFFRERYGEWILYDPKLKKNTYILWLLPILIFLIGGAIIIKSFVFKKN